MKDKIITNKMPLEINSPGSLPNIINLGQFRSRLSDPSFITGPSIDKTKTITIPGSLENQEFDFEIDPGEADDWMKKLKNIIVDGSKRNIYKINRDLLFNNYIIFEVPDYGQLSMSTYYRDFVPHIYLDGCKIWQKYISIIKYYTAKKAYILIMKENNLGVKTSDNFKTSDNKSNTIIRICYKNTKENYDILATHYCEEGEKPNINNLNTSDFKEYSLYSTSFIFDGYLNGDIISDYDYFYEDNKKFKKINPELIEEVTLEDLNGLRTLYEQKNYFRQTFNIDSSTGRPELRDDTDFERKVSVKITIKLKTNNESIETIYLKSKYNNPKAKYTKETINNYNIDYEMFNKAGKRIEKNETGEEVELIPEYSSKRKIVLRDSRDTLATTLNKYVPIYRSNLKNGEILVYDSNGLFKGTTIESESTLIIYDNNEEEDKTVISTGSNTDFDINRNSEELPDGDTIDSTEYSTKKPISTFLMKLSNNNPAPNAYIICRCFPIPLDHYYIAKDLVYYKLPDYFYAPKNLYNRTEEYGEYKKETGENLNKFILDSIEPVIYFDDKNLKNLFNINNINNLTDSDFSKDYSALLDKDLNNNSLTIRLGIYGNSAWLNPPISLDPGQYTISCNCEYKNNNFNSHLMVGRKNGETIEKINDTSYISKDEYNKLKKLTLTFTLDKKEEIYLSLQGDGNINNYNNVDIIFKNIQLEKGPNATSYKPYLSFLSSSSFYDINNINETIYRGEKTKLIGNCHIINYDERFEKIFNITDDNSKSSDVYIKEGGFYSEQVSGSATTHIYYLKNYSHGTYKLSYEQLKGCVKNLRFLSTIQIDDTFIYNNFYKAYFKDISSETKNIIFTANKDFKFGLVLISDKEDASYPGGVSNIHFERIE